MFDPEIQHDVRNRFLIDSRYYNDLGCYYNLTDRINQPIIEDGYFFNPGSMSPFEYNEMVHKILADDMSLENINPIINFDKIYVNNHKKMYMLDLFNKFIIKTNLNETYRSYRLLWNETKDESEKIIMRQKMFVHIREILTYIKDFVDIEQFIDKLKIGSIYSYETELTKIINSILKINLNILDNNLINQHQPNQLNQLNQLNQHQPNQPNQPNQLNQHQQNIMDV
jgi:hypothetical protein